MVENGEPGARPASRANRGSNGTTIAQWKWHRRFDHAGARSVRCVFSRLTDGRVTMVGDENFVASRQLEGVEHGVATDRRVFDEYEITISGPDELGKTRCGGTQRSWQVIRHKASRMPLHASAPAVLLGQNSARRCPKRTVVEKYHVRIE
jgi:hypothetical protein